MKELKKYAPLISAALGLIALIMLFLPAIVAGEDVIKGTQAVFGWTEEVNVLVGVKKVEMLEFSFMNLLTYVLVIAGIALAVLAFLQKKELFAFIAAGCFAVAAVFFFCAIGFTVVAEGWNELAALVNGDIKAEWKLGAGAVIGGICSILAVAAAVAPVVLKKLGK